MVISGSLSCILTSGLVSFKESLSADRHCVCVSAERSCNEVCRLHGSGSLSCIPTSGLLSFKERLSAGRHCVWSAMKPADCKSHCRLFQYRFVSLISVLRHWLRLSLSPELSLSCFAGLGRLQLQALSFGSHPSTLRTLSRVCFPLSLSVLHSTMKDCSSSSSNFATPTHAPWNRCLPASNDRGLASIFHFLSFSSRLEVVSNRQKELNHLAGVTDGGRRLQIEGWNRQGDDQTTQKRNYK